MLVRFEVENFRSIREPVELSMVSLDDRRPGTRYENNLGHSVVPVAGVYGPNASGKSNLLSALQWLLTGIRDSLRFWDDGIPTDPFAFRDDSVGRESRFEIEYVVDGVRFEYLVELDRHAVAYEALFHYPEKRRRRVFERENGELNLQRGLGSISGTRELLTGRSLVLSIARRFEEPLISAFVLQVLDAQYFGLRRLGRRRFSRGTSSLRLFDRPDTVEAGSSTEERKRRSLRDRAVQMLRLADLGIEDVVLDPERDTPQLLHRTVGAPTPLDLDEESSGTRTWFELVVPVLQTLDRGSLLLFDELDASLHPTLSAALVGLFNSPASNPLGAQLVFTSHDTSLLDHLNRDEVWLTEKDDNGATSLTALAEFDSFRVQSSTELEQGYLGGRFGAIPDVDRSKILRALGLTG